MRVLPRPRPPPLLSLDDALFAEISDERAVAAVVPVPPIIEETPPEGPSPFNDVNFDMDETAVIGPPSARTARGWAYRADKVLVPQPGKTLRDAHGRMLFSRAEFLRVPGDTLRLLAAYGVVIDVGRIPWGAFKGEEESLDQEVDYERLRAWLEER